MARLEKDNHNPTEHLSSHDKEASETHLLLSVALLMLGILIGAWCLPNRLYIDCFKYGSINVWGLEAY